MSKELSPYLIRRNRQPRKPPRVTVLAEDVESTIQDDLHQYWRVVRKHLGLVLAVPAVLVALAILRDAMTTPLYTASATLLIREHAAGDARKRHRRNCFAKLRQLRLGRRGPDPKRAA